MIVNIDQITAAVRRFLLRRTKGFYRKMVYRTLADMNSTVVEELTVYYTTDQFAEFVRSVLVLLRDNDPLDYNRCLRHVKAIAEYSTVAAKYGIVSAADSGVSNGIFLDTYSENVRNSVGVKQYAGLLIRFSTLVRVQQDFGIYPTAAKGSVNYLRIEHILAARELHVCSELGGGLQQQFAIERRMRGLREKLRTRYNPER